MAWWTLFLNVFSSAYAPCYFCCYYNSLCGVTMDQEIIDEINELKTKLFEKCHERDIPLCVAIKIDDENVSGSFNGKASDIFTAIVSVVTDADPVLLPALALFIEDIMKDACIDKTEMN